MDISNFGVIVLFFLSNIFSTGYGADFPKSKHGLKQHKSGIHKRPISAFKARLSSKPTIKLPVIQQEDVNYLQPIKILRSNRKKHYNKQRIVRNKRSLMDFMGGGGKMGGGGRMGGGCSMGCGGMGGMGGMGGKGGFDFMSLIRDLPGKVMMLMSGAKMMMSGD